MPRRPNEITRREMWFATSVYRLTQAQQALAKFRYRRLDGRCYACPGKYGAHKFSCSVGIRENSLTREGGVTWK